MRRLTSFGYAALCLAVIVSASSCRRGEDIKPTPTDESQPVLGSMVHAADPKSTVQMTKGFHGVEQNAWRWTMGRFAVALAPPPGSAEKGASLIVKFSVPEVVIQRLGKTVLTAVIQGTALRSEAYISAGEQTFLAEVPPTLLKGEAALVEFSLDPFLPAGSLDGRELGVVFVSAGLEAK